MQFALMPLSIAFVIAAMRNRKMRFVSMMIVEKLEYKHQRSMRTVLDNKDVIFALLFCEKRHAFDKAVCHFQIAAQINGSEENEPVFGIERNVWHCGQCIGGRDTVSLHRTARYAKKILKKGKQDATRFVADSQNLIAVFLSDKKNQQSCPL